MRNLEVPVRRLSRVATPRLNVCHDRSVTTAGVETERRHDQFELGTHGYSRNPDQPALIARTSEARSSTGIMGSPPLVLTGRLRM